MAHGEMTEVAAQAFADKLEAFGQTLSTEERHFLNVILAAAAAFGDEVQGYSNVDPTGLSIGETAAQVYYQYADLKESGL